MAFETIKDNIQRLKETIKDFADSNAQYYKLLLLDKSVKGIATLIKFVLIALFLLFCLLFLSIGFSIWISTAIGVASAGFFIVAGVYLLLFLFVQLVGGKMIGKMLLGKFSQIYFESLENSTESKKKKDEQETL